MNISEIFIRRPIATTLLMTGVLLFGFFCYELLPVAALPNVDFPTIVVTAQFPGASPTTMAETVATPLENEFTQIPGVAQMTSTSGLGQTTITLQFDLTVDINGAASQVQQEINAAGGLLPKTMPTPPTYRETNPADRPILIYAVHSDAMPTYQLDTYANTVLAQSLSTINGVGQVSIGGEQQPAVAVQVDPEALASRGLGLGQIETALTTATLEAPKGALEGPQQQFTLSTNDQLSQPDQFGEVIVAYQNGAPVKLKDIAEIVNSAQSPFSGAWYDRKSAELLLIFRAAGANTVQVVDDVKARLPQLEQSIPPSVHVDLLSDRSQDIRASVSDVETTLVITVILVVLIIFAFLRKVWATAIPSVTVPLSIIATFGVMYLFGYSLDNLSLMALTIAVGFVVDDAIVMIENIVRYIEAGDNAFDAALKGAGQIGFTIISITFSLIAVFIPLLFMSGIVGRLFHEFAMTVSIAVVASAFIALTLTPMMCSLFLSRESDQPKGRINRAFESFFDWMLAEYDRGLKWVFQHQLSMLLLTLIPRRGHGLPLLRHSKGISSGAGYRLSLWRNSKLGRMRSFPAMTKLQDQIAAIVLQDPAVSGMVSFAGSTGGNSSENTARMFIQLKPFGRRAGIEEVMSRLRPKVAQVIGARFYMQAAQDITVGGRLEQAQYQYTLTDTELRRAQSLGADFAVEDAINEDSGRRRLRPADRCAGNRRGGRSRRGVDLRRDTIRGRHRALCGLWPAASDHDLSSDAATESTAGSPAEIPDPTDRPLADLCRGHQQHRHHHAGTAVGSRALHRQSRAIDDQSPRRFSLCHIII